MTATDNMIAMKKYLQLVLMALLCVMWAQPALARKTLAEKAGWRLAVQSYTFHKFTLMEALDKTQQLGVKYIEVYPGHRIGGRWGDQVFGPQLTSDDRRELRAEAARRGIRIVGTGVFTSDKREDWEQMFQLAHEMRMDYITCEPPMDMWDYIEALSDKYKMKVAVHNHPKPSEYWNPQRLLDAVKGRSSRLGSCADVGHWNREGMDPIDCLERLRGRVISLHFKDIMPKEDEGGTQTDTIWGEGCLGVRDMLLELKDQKFRGYLAIEYETNWDNSVPDIQRCIEYYNKVCNEILR